MKENGLQGTSPGHGALASSPDKEHSRGLLSLCSPPWGRKGDFSSDSGVLSWGHFPHLGPLSMERMRLKEEAGGISCCSRPDTRSANPRGSHGARRGSRGAACYPVHLHSRPVVRLSGQVLLLLQQTTTLTYCVGLAGPLLRAPQGQNQGVRRTRFLSGGPEEESALKLTEVVCRTVPCSCGAEGPFSLLAIGQEPL